MQFIYTGEFSGNLSRIAGERTSEWLELYRIAQETQTIDLVEYSRHIVCDRIKWYSDIEVASLAIKYQDQQLLEFCRWSAKQHPALYGKDYYEGKAKHMSTQQCMEELIVANILGLEDAENGIVDCIPVRNWDDLLTVFRHTLEIRDRLGAGCALYEKLEQKCYSQVHRYGFWVKSLFKDIESHEKAWALFKELLTSPLPKFVAISKEGPLCLLQDEEIQNIWVEQPAQAQLPALSTMEQQITLLVNQASFRDFTFVVKQQDGSIVEIPIHRVILAYHSEFFKQFFDQCFDMRAEFPFAADSCIVKDFIHFIYTKKLPEQGLRTATTTCLYTN